MTHYNTFRDQLAIAHPAFGYALWEPDPGEQYPPVEVGDVGFVRQGKFHRLFNALLPANHQSHRRFGVPEHYEPLQLSVPDHIDHGTLYPNNFCSYGVRVESGDSGLFAVAPPTSDSADVSFSCTRKQGAALSLPVVARREDTLSQAHFGKWMTKHIDSLFAFSQRHGLGIETEDIVLVTGCHRTRSWSNIAFYESQADSRVSLSVKTPSTNGTTVRWRVLSQGMQGAVLHHGPSGENLPDSQCLFIRGFRVKRIFWIIPRLKGAAEPQRDDSGGNDYEPELELVPIPNITERQDPLHVLLEYIATRAPDCDMALVHDDDLIRILEVGDGTSLETLRPDVVMDYLQKSKLDIGVMSDSWTTNNGSPRTDTERMTVAMLSERLHTLCPPASVPVHSGSTMDTVEMTDDHGPSVQSRNLSDSSSVITESQISVDITNTAERFLSVGRSGVSKSSLVSDASSISNTDVSQYKPGEQDVQHESSRTGDSGCEDETCRNRAKMRADDGERQASFPTNRITVGLPGSGNLARPSDPETSGSDAELLTSGASSETAFDPGNDSCVMDTDVELECAPRYTFSRGEEADWYVDDPKECLKEAGSPVVFASVGSDDDDYDSDVSETGSRALAAIQRSSIAIRVASMRDHSFRGRYPDRVHTQPNMRPREELTMPPQFPAQANIDAEGDVSATVTGSNRDQDAPSVPRNWADNPDIPPTDDSGEEIYQGTNLDYILSKDRRKLKNKNKRMKGKEKLKSEESGSFSDSPNLLGVAPGTDILGPRRPSTVTADDSDSFAHGPRHVNPDVSRRNGWSFIRNRERVSFPPRAFNSNRRYWDVWRCSQIGQIRVGRVTLSSPFDPNKPTQQRLNAEHDIDLDSANTLGGPTTVVHRHSKALAFSIYRNYRDYPSRRARKSAATTSTNSPRSSETRTRIAPMHDCILLATKRVQEQQFTTKSTRNLGIRGLSPEERDNRRDTPRKPLSTITTSASSTLTPHDGAEEESDREFTKSVSRTSYAEASSPLDKSTIDWLGNEQVPATATRRSLGWVQRFNDPPGGSTARVLSSSVAPIIPPWMTLVPRSQDEARMSLSSSFKDVGLVPSTRSKGNAVRRRRSKGKNKDALTQVPDDSMCMLLPLWPHETDPASAAHTGRERKAVADQGQKLYLLVYYVPFDKLGEDKPTTTKRSRPIPPLKGEREGQYPTPQFDVRRGLKIMGRLFAHSDLRGSRIRLPVRGLSVTGSLAEAELAIPPVHSDDFLMGSCVDPNGTIVDLFPEGLEKLGLCVPRTEPPVQDHTLPGMQTAELEDEEVAFQPLTAIGRAAVEIAWLGCMALMTFYGPQSEPEVST